MFLWTIIPVVFETLNYIQLKKFGFRKKELNQILAMTEKILDLLFGRSWNSGLSQVTSWPGLEMTNCTLYPTRSGSSLAILSLASCTVVSTSLRPVGGSGFTPLVSSNTRLIMPSLLRAWHWYWPYSDSSWMNICKQIHIQNVGGIIKTGLIKRTLNIYHTRKHEL